MADNTKMGSTVDDISTDELTTLNGAAVVGVVKAQRVKAGWGADGIFNDTTAATPMPVSIATMPSTPVTGTFFQATQPVSFAALPTGANNVGSFNLASNGTLISSRADGFVRTVTDPSTLLYDTFETMDTTNTWTVGGTVPPTGTNGLLTVSAGTAASGSSWAVSKPAFVPGSSAYLQLATIMTLAAAAETGNKRVMGLGTIAASPTAAIPIANGVVFEVGVDGVLYGATYSNNVRTQNVALTRPTDGLVHRYSIYYKASRAYFELDNVAVGSLPFPNPQVAQLPTVIGSFNDTAALGAAATLTATLIGVADTARNSNQISDGTYAWRKAQVGKNGGLSVKGTSIVGQTLNVVAATPVIGAALDVSEAGNATFTVKNTVAGTGYVGAPVLVFEQSDDSQSWGPLAVTRSDTSATAATFTLGTNAANAALMFDCALEGVNFIRIRVTTAPTTNGMTVVISAGGMPFMPAVSAIQQPVVKGTQGTTGVTTQDLKDAGRNLTTYYMALPQVTTAADALVTLAGYKSGAAVAGVTGTAGVTAGKTLRLESVVINYISVATGGGARISLRAVSTGTAAVGSPVVISWFVGGPTSATAGLWANLSIPLPDGMEFPAGTSFSVTIVGINATGAAAVAGYASISINGYEY